MLKLDKYEGKCFLCGKSGAAVPLEVHHAIHGPYRKKADKYGLVVLLCTDCHRNAPNAAHRCGATDVLLKQWAQKKAMEEQGWTVDEFRSVFGKNYLDLEECE